MEANGILGSRRVRQRPVETRGDTAESRETLGNTGVSGIFAELLGFLEVLQRPEEICVVTRRLRDLRRKHWSPAESWTSRRVLRSHAEVLRNPTKSHGVPRSPAESVESRGVLRSVTECDGV